MTDGHASIFTALADQNEKTKSGGGGGGGGGKSKNKLAENAKSVRIRMISTTVRFNKFQHLSGKRINNVIKARFVPNNHDATRHIIQHTDYILTRERQPEEPERKFFNSYRNDIGREEVLETMLGSKGKAAMFKLIFSPDQNELDHEDYIREIMARWEEMTGIHSEWVGVKHANTDHHHVHVEIPGKDLDGKAIFLTKEHLEALREIANEHQYELQRRDYEYDRGVQDEFFPSDRYDEALRIWEYQNARELMRDLVPGYDEMDKAVKELLPSANFDPLQFRNDLQKEMAERAFEIDKLSNPEKYPDNPYQITDQEHNAYIDLFKKTYPELSERDPRPALLKEREQDILEKHPELAARYSPQAEQYYLEKLGEHLKEYPEDAQRYKVDASQEGQSAEDVIKQFLSHHPQLAPELAMDPEHAPEQEHERNWDVNDIDLSKIPDNEKIDVKGHVFTKYHPAEELDKLDNYLQADYSNRIPVEQYSMLGTWRTAKEHRGDDCYGRPPCKGDPDRDPHELAIEALTQQIKGYNERYQELVPRFKQDSTELLLAQIGKVDQWYPTLLPEFREAARDYFNGILDEFPELLPGHEDELARELFKLQKAAETEHAENEKDKLPADQDERTKEDSEKREEPSLDKGDQDSRLVDIMRSESGEKEMDETAKAIWDIVKAKELPLEDLDPVDRKLAVEKLMDRAEHDPSFVDEVKDIDPKELLWNLNNTDDEHEYREFALEQQEHTQALLDINYAPADEKMETHAEGPDDEENKRHEQEEREHKDDDESRGGRGSR